MIQERDGRPSLPTGTVTFLRTDVEGSMAMARSLGARWDDVNADHLALIRRAVTDHGGTCVRTEGDAMFAVFPEAGAAVAGAIAAQKSIASHDWPPHAQVRVRMGLHSGEAHLAGDDYGGFEVNRAARIAATGHGGQIVLSETTRALVADALPDGVSLRDLGRHMLKDIARPETLYQLDVPGLQTDFPLLRTVTPTIGNLPTRMTSLVGREAELEELGGLLQAGRLVTLTGPGGIGKTSLAVELARQHAAMFLDGAWFVTLAPLGHVELVTSAIARTLGLFDGPERSAANALPAFLRDRSVLLVLDNFEHLLEASGEVAAILRSSPTSRVIVTSRAPLRIAGEQEYPVRPLGDAAIPLFVERARSVQPGWDPGADTLVVEEICALLDGLPLGIELAAARVSLLPLDAIRDRLAARLPLPGSGPRDVPDRQRTLEGAIAWSHELLSPDLQRLLHELAVFEGGFDVERAELVTSRGPDRWDLLDSLVTLAEHSLIKPATDGPSRSRYRLLLTIQAFALDRLVAEGRDTEVRRRHALAYLALAESAATHLPGPDQPRWLDRLATDHANLRSALRWAIDAGETEIALRFLPALWRFWQMDGHLHEGRILADLALAMPGADEQTPIRLAAVAAGGNIAYWQADSVAARRLYEAQVELARLIGDPVAVADAVFNLGHVSFVEGGDPATTLEFLADSRRHFEAIGDERGMARVDWGRGTMMMSMGAVDQAIEMFQTLLPRFESLGDVHYHSMTLSSLGWSAFVQGDLIGASKWSIRALGAAHRLRDVASTTLTIQEGVVLAKAFGRPEDAAVLSGAFTAHCERYGVRPPASLQRFLDTRDPMAESRAALGTEAYQAAIERGRRMSLDEAVDLMVRIADEATGVAKEA